jgi:hypothetical protein
VFRIRIGVIQDLDPAFYLIPYPEQGKAELLPFYFLYIGFSLVKSKKLTIGSKTY